VTARGPGVCSGPGSRANGADEDIRGRRIHDGPSEVHRGSPARRILGEGRWSMACSPWPTAQ